MINIDGATEIGGKTLAMYKMLFKREFESLLVLDISLTSIHTAYDTKHY